MNTQMNLRENIQTALLLAIGLMMHGTVPGIMGGMKFDFMLAFIFIAIFLNPSFKNTMMTALVGGFLSAMTTTFPGGQIPNIIDKFVTCLFVYLVIKVMTQVGKMNMLGYGLISIGGTIISVSVFLGTAMGMMGLPLPISLLIMTVVLPRAAGNLIVTTTIYAALARVKTLTRA